MTKYVTKRINIIFMLDEDNELLNVSKRQFWVEVVKSSIPQRIIMNKCKVLSYLN